MLTIGMLGLFAAYGVGSYGYVLLHGWDIPPRQWWSPLNPYTWPKYPDEPTKIPATQLWPSAKSATAAVAAQD
jgi:hypothetical protein